MAGDVSATATAGAAGIGEPAELVDETREDTVQAAATRPDGGVPAGQETQRGSQPVVSGAQGVPPGVGVRRRLARLGAQRGSGMNPVLEPLMKTIRATHPKADIRMVERAYDVAAHWHREQKRKSGDPYITHPLAVATILAELGIDRKSVV